MISIFRCQNTEEIKAVPINPSEKKNWGMLNIIVVPGVLIIIEGPNGKRAQLTFFDRSLFFVV